jgi:uncharacterized protein
MKLKTIMATHAVVSGILGMSSVLASSEIRLLYSMESSESSLVLVQYAGLGSVALALIAWFSRNVVNKKALKAISSALLLSCIAGVAISLAGSMSGVLKNGWMAVGLYLFFALSYLYFYFMPEITEPKKIFNKWQRIISVLLLMFLSAEVLAVVPQNIIINHNGILLKGKFYAAEGAGPFPTLLLLQGIPGNENDVIGLCGFLSEKGISALTFNYSGTFQSEGLISFSNCQADINAVIKFLNEPGNQENFKIDPSKFVLGGYSFGGGMAVTYAINHPEINYLISIAGNDWGEYMMDYAEDTEMQARLDANINNIEAKGIYRFVPGEKPSDKLAEGFRDFDPAFFQKRNAARLAPKNILLISGWDDSGVTIERHILPLYRELKKEQAQNVKIVAYQDDHSFSHSREAMGNMIAEWIVQVFK